MSCQNGCFRHADGLRVRPVPELEACIVFASRQPKLYMLNLGAWLLFELCDGRSPEDLRAAYVAAAAAGRDDEAVREEMRVAIDQLLDDGLIQQVAA